jgi:hypothetical protein
MELLFQDARNEVDLMALVLVVCLATFFSNKQPIGSAAPSAMNTRMGIIP